MSANDQGSSEDKSVANDAAQEGARPPQNPFVGPEPLEEGQPLHGRRRETEELTNLLVGKRIVLLFSPSGAGKTSLIRAGLLRRLDDYDIQALPIVRLGYRDPELRGDTSVNRYRLATLSALEARRPEGERLGMRELSGYSLQRYFDERVFDFMDLDDEKRPKYPLLIVDQLEELFVDPLDVACKREFLAELGDLLRGAPGGRGGGDAGAPIWALFAIREDRAAELQPYLDFFPTSLAFRYRLDALGVEAGREVIRETAKAPQSAGEWIQADVPAVIVNDLSTVSVLGEDGVETLQPGPVLEPVQLQIVCRGLWDKVVRAQRRPITVDDVNSHGHSEVNRALGDFYNEEVARAVEDTDVSERALREWIGTELISPSGVRTQCLYEPAMFGEDNCVIGRLVDAHVLRLEKRAGRDWIELPHDRLVGPVRESNFAWANQHLKEFQKRAQQWHTASGEYTRLLLLNEKELAQANAYTQAHPRHVNEKEREFLKASEQEVSRVRDQGRNRRRIWMISGGFVLALAVLGIAWGVNEIRERNAERLRIAVEQGTSRAGRGSPGAALDGLLALRENVTKEGHHEELVRDVDDAIRQALTRTPAAVVKELQSGKHIVWSLAFSGDGKQVFAGSWDGHVSVQDVDASDKAPSVTDDLQTPTYAVVVQPGTGLVASTHGDGRTLLWQWDGNRLQRIGTLVPPRPDLKQVPSAAFSDDGRWLVVGGWDKQLDVWDVGNPRAPRLASSIVNGQAPIQSLAFVPAQDASRMQQLISTDYDGKVRVWSIGEGMPDRPRPEREFAVSDQAKRDIGISASTVSPSGRYFVAGDTEGTVYMWDLRAPGAATPGWRFEWPNHRGGGGGDVNTHVKGIAFAPDSTSFVSVGVDGYLVRWTLPANADNFADVVAGMSKQRFRVGERLYSAAYRPGARNQVAVGGTRSIRLLELDRGPGGALSTPLPRSDRYGSSWRAVSMDAAGKRVAARADTGPILMWLKGANGFRTMPEWRIGGSRAVGFALTPDGQRLVTVDCRGTPVDWTLRPGSIPQRTATFGTEVMDCGKRPTPMPVLSADGRLLAAADANVVRIWKRTGRDGQGAWEPFATRKFAPRTDDEDVAGREDRISAMAFGANALAVGTVTGGLQVLQLGDRNVSPMANVDNGVAVRALSFNRAGTRLRVGGEDGFITTYELSPFKRLRVSERHEREISGIESVLAKGVGNRWFTADVEGYVLEMELLSSKSKDGRTPITATEVSRRDSGPIWAIALDRDGTFLVTAGEALLGWDLSQRNVLANAQARRKAAAPDAQGATTR